MFLRIMQILGPCSIDLFASRLDNQLTRYVSWHPDPHAIATDAFRERQYMLSPLRIDRQMPPKGVPGVVLVRDTQPWYPVVLDLLVDYPLLIPTHNRLLQDPFNRIHAPRSSSLLEGIRKSHRTEGISERASNLILSGWSKGTNTTYQSDGIAGVLQGRQIPFGRCAALPRIFG